MAIPGQSEEQRRQERQQEISDKISKLKNEGRMNKGSVASTEDSMMLEAEQFFNKESPLKKFARKKLEWEQKEAAEQKRKKEEDEEII
jgi:hypothetical protein